MGYNSNAEFEMEAEILRTHSKYLSSLDPDPSTDMIIEDLNARHQKVLDGLKSMHDRKVGLMEEVQNRLREEGVTRLCDYVRIDPIRLGYEVVIGFGEVSVPVRKKDGALYTKPRSKASPEPWDSLFDQFRASLILEITRMATEERHA